MVMGEVAVSATAAEGVVLVVMLIIVAMIIVIWISNSHTIMEMTCEHYVWREMCIGM